MGLIVLFTLGLAVLVMVLLVWSLSLWWKVTGPTICWPLCLEWGKPTHVQLSDLGLSFLLHVFSRPLGKGASFCKWIGVWVEQPFLLPFLLLVCIYFLLQGQEWFHLQGLQVAVLTVCCFLNVWIPWTVLTVNYICIVPLGGKQQRKLKKKSHVGLSSQAIVCKNIYTEFIQVLLKDHWKAR